MFEYMKLETVNIANREGVWSRYMVSKGAAAVRTKIIGSKELQFQVFRTEETTDHRS